MTEMEWGTLSQVQKTQYENIVRLAEALIDRIDDKKQQAECIMHLSTPKPSLQAHITHINKVCNLALIILKEELQEEE